jgi:hypothetical protein
VRTAQEYRHYAKACLKLANTFQQSQAKDTLLHMAQVWQRLAQEAEVQAKVSQPD